MAAADITRHTTAGGVRIYRIPLQAFPTLQVYAHIVVAGDYLALIDVGSGMEQSDADLCAGMDTLRADWGERFGWGDLSRIIVTHAHIDHYGGLAAVRAQSSAPIAVHALDRRVLTHHAERLTLASRAIAVFLRRAGIPPERHAQLMAMYGWSKELFRSVEVADTLEDGDTLDGLFTVWHAPGHCPGQVCLQIEDVLLTADHVLPRTALFLSPESITPSTGVEHYLLALRRIATVPGVRLALGGHEEPIEDFYDCVERVAAGQIQRIERVRDACGTACTIAELTQAIYPQLSGYDSLLALQKIGAYVEYLDQRGELAIDNLEAVAADESIPPRYLRV